MHCDRMPDVDLTRVAGMAPANEAGKKLNELKGYQGVRLKR
jgi:hypothetical protein